MLTERDLKYGSSCTFFFCHFVHRVAGRREQDIPLMRAKEEEMKVEGKDVALELLEDRGLLALQGPTMMQCLQPLTSLPLDNLAFMHSALVEVAGIQCRVTR